MDAYLVYLKSECLKLGHKELRTEKNTGMFSFSTIFY